MRTPRFHPEAVEEAVAATDWYRERSPASALAFAAELERAVEAIFQAPENWSQHLLSTRRFLLRRFPFAVVYRMGPRGIEIIAVAHAKRRPGYWRSR
ncbi:MAG: type II toxin-antitoxin system RelE/ParE family toxin [Candidatus Riflebacteria bacterium]|nr:type II toxin-antitoxin system RelE/ParE family toxin [Candidatus Riflebacteria bacterium]